MKNEQRHTVKIVDRRAGNLRVKKVGRQPDLDPLEFAGVDDLLDHVKLRVAGADQNDVGRVFVQVLHEVANRLAVDVKLLHHAETVVLSSPDALEHLASLLPGAKQDEAFLQIGTGHPTAADQLPQLLFRQNRHHTDGGKQKENRAG